MRYLVIFAVAAILAGCAGQQVNVDTSTAVAMETVQVHGSESGCYTAINGKVYDLTGWIKSHPGGPKSILGLCGTDGTEMLEKMHGGQAKPRERLAGFQVGVLG